MSRIFLHLIVFLAICTPFFFLYQNNEAQAFADNPKYFVQELFDEGFFTEDDTQYFNGHKSITRGVFLQWLLQDDVKTVEAYKDFSHPFIDISAEEAIAPYVATAYSLGILDAFEGDKKFLPQRSLTRLQALSLFIKYYNLDTSEVNAKNIAPFWNDLPENGRDRNRILYGIEKGYFRSEEEGSIYPFNIMTREEAAWMFYVYKKNPIEEIDEGKTVVIEIPQKTSVEQAQDIIQSQYLKNDEIEENQLEEAAIKGIAESLGDDFSVYFPPEEAEKFENYFDEEDLSEEEYAGLGVAVQKAKNGGLVITEIFAGSPAQKVDIKTGDIIIGVGDENIQDLDTNDIVEKIKGPIGTEQKLEIMRNEKTIIRFFTRDKIYPESLPSIYAEEIDNIVWIRVRSFKVPTAIEFENILQEYVQPYTRGVIVDLRYNAGGVMESAIGMLGEVLPKKSIAVRLQSNSGERVYKTEGSAEYTAVPLVVFQNEYSASASEIFSAAIQDHERGDVIGKTSFGKGVAQSLFYLDHGSLKLTTAEFFSPKGNAIHSIGVAPDIILDAADDESFFYEAKKAFDQ